MRVSILVGVAFLAMTLGPQTALAQSPEKVERITPGPKAPAKPAAPRLPEASATVTAATDPKLRDALARAETPLPSDLVLRRPGAGVPRETAAFYGIWMGKFSNGRPITTVVESVGPAGDAIVIHSWAARKGHYDGGHQRARAQLQGGVLRAATRSNKMEWRMLDADRIELTTDNQFGIGRAILTRIY